MFLPMASFARRFARGAATDAFTALEHKMWQAGAAAYSDSFAKVTGMATTALLDNAHVGLTSAMAVAIVERTALESREGGLRVLTWPPARHGRRCRRRREARRGEHELEPEPEPERDPYPYPYPYPYPQPYPTLPLTRGRRARLLVGDDRARAGLPPSP